MRGTVTGRLGAWMTDEAGNTTGKKGDWCNKSCVNAQINSEQTLSPFWNVKIKKERSKVTISFLEPGDWGKVAFTKLWKTEVGCKVDDDSQFDH